MDKEIIKKKIQRILNHFQVGDYAYTIRESNTLLKKLPDNIFLINLIGSCYLNLGNFKMASDAFVHIINLDNKNIAAYNNLGNVFKAQKKFEDAEKNYNKALEINPSFINSMVNLGNLYFERNNYQKAIENYLKALKIDDKNSLTHYNLGLVYHSIGEFDNSHKAFEKVLPSKLFEYASTGKPIWAGLRGYASDFINENIDNCAIFSPFDIEEAELAFKKLKVVTMPRHRFNKEFSSKEILDKMAKDIIRFAQKDEA